MATSTFSPRPATLNKPLRAGIQLHLIPFPHLRAGRLVCATAAGEAPPVEVEQRDEAEPAPAAASNGAAVKAEAPAAKTEPPPVPAFRDARWVNGTWDLTKFDKGGGVDWDAVIDAGEGSDSSFLVLVSLCCRARLQVWASEKVAKQAPKSRRVCEDMVQLDVEPWIGFTCWSGNVCHCDSNL